MDLGLRDRVALLPAASAGIGRAAAAEFAAAGARLAICGRNRGRLETAAAELKAMGAADVLAVVADCMVAAEVEGLVRETQARYGRIDILVANSPGPLARPFEQLSDEDWRVALDTKVVTQIRQARLVFPGMRERGWGRIIFLAGTHGLQPHAYAITAGAVNAALLSIAKGLAEAGAGHGVLVNAINPGPIDTERMRYLAERKSTAEGISLEAARRALCSEVMLGRFGEAAEVAAAIAFLASQRASFITGTLLNVDGGQTKSI